MKVHPRKTSGPRHTPAGLVLGADPSRERSCGTLPLPGGHTLLLYTDGLIETRHDCLDDRLSALREHPAGHAATPVADFCDAVLGFAPQPGDDIALPAIRLPQD